MTRPLTSCSSGHRQAVPNAAVTRTRRGTLSPRPPFAVAATLAAVMTLGCAAPKPPIGAPPAPQTVSKKKPGGNARDPHRAALERQLLQDWGDRTDKDRQARFPLPDHRNWTRVRFSLVKHFTGFRYGKKHHAITAAFVVPLKEGDPPTSEQCIARFEEEAQMQVDELGGRVSEAQTVKQAWGEMPITVRTATGKIDVLFQRHEVAAAWTGYPAYPGQCMVYAVVVPWRKHRQLAEQVRDRWVAGGFHRFVPLTQEAPSRR